MTRLSTVQTGTDPLFLPQGASTPKVMSSTSLAAWQGKHMQMHIEMSLEAKYAREE
jgi:hypothetical protein